MPANSTPATWPSGHHFKERHCATALIMRDFSAAHFYRDGPGLGRVVSQIKKRTSREGRRRAVDRLTQPAQAAGKGRVRPPRSRGAVPLRDGLLANGQPARHADRQKGWDENSWMTRGHDLRTMTRHFLQAVTHATRHLANKAAGLLGKKAIIHAATQSPDCHQGGQTGSGCKGQMGSHANRQTGIKSGGRQNFLPNGQAVAAPQQCIRQIPQ